MNRTFVIIKPDGIHKNLVEEIIKRIEEQGLEISKIKKIKLNEKQCIKLYGESMKKFPQIKQAIIDYMTEDEVIIAVAQGENAIIKTRKIRGLSDPSKSPIGSVRRDFAGDQKMEELTKIGLVTKNIMHSSGSEEEVKEEIKLFFGEESEI